jgi:hypothetical protein
VAIVTGVLLVHMHPLKCVALRTVHHALVIQTVKQTVQLFSKRYTEDVTTMQQLTRVVGTSMCIEHIIDPAYHQEENNQRIEDW